MNSSQIPARLPIPFANNAGSSYRRVIPTPHSSTPGAASFYDGFPPECFLSPTAGGVPPFGQDFNGILYQTTAGMRWLQSGGLPSYDATHSTDIGGYPLGAVLISADGTHFWRSTAENNVTDPDTGGAGWVVLQPGSYPFSSITGVPTFVLASAFTGANQTLGATGFQAFPGGLIRQRVNVAVTGAANNEVTITYPVAFSTASSAPIPSVVDPSTSGGNESNFLGLSVVSYSLTGCVIAMGQNGGGVRNVTLHVEVEGN